jgi:hypothetical protein
MTDVKSEKPKPLFRRTGLLLGSGIIVLIALTAGGVVWHQYPSFCGNCHTPMTSYIDGYKGGDETLMITSHAKAKNTVRCVDCHKQTIREMATEGIHWLTGNYDFPLRKRKFGTRTFCLASGCHDENKIMKASQGEKIAKAVNPIGDAVRYNQHDPRHGKQDCNRCHSVHGRSVLMCNQCHKLQAPKGWQSPAANGLIAAN